MMDKRTNGRKSPSFPSLGLSKAIHLASKIYAVAFDSTLDTQTMLELMGFRGVSGASRTALSSLKQFGLVEGRDTENRITKLAAQIIRPVEELERLSAILEASRKPPIFNEIFSQFKGTLPDEKVIKAFLVRNHGFSDVGADSLVKCLKETEEYTAPIRQQYRFSLPFEEQKIPVAENSLDIQKAIENKIQPSWTPNSESEATEIMRVRLAANCLAIVSFEGDIDQKAINKLISFLELSKDSYPS